MTEMVGGLSAHGRGVPEAASAGALLRSAREAAGVHIAALAVALKVPVSRLEALEADRFDMLPDAPFVRALAGSVCRVLKVDAAPVLARLPQGSLARLREDVGHGATRFHSQPAGAAGRAAPLARPMVWAVLLLLLGAAALVLMPEARLGAWTAQVGEWVREHSPAGRTEADSPAASGSAVESVEVPAAALAPLGAAQPAAGAVSPPQAVAPSSPGAPAAPSPAGKVGGAVGVAVTGGGSGSTAAPGSMSAVAPPAASADGKGDGPLVLRAKADTWVKVTDASGKVLVQKLLSTGASESVTGTMPLAVVIGRADAATVEVRGQAFDLGAIARNNVARFEVR